MPLQLDHAVIAVTDLDTAIQDYRSLGFIVVRGGVHANRATHNALITFSNGTYLELLAATNEPIRPGVIDFSIMLQHGEGLVGFALRSNDLAADATRLRANGFSVGNAIPGERCREDGTLVQWKLMLLDGGFAPFLIEDVTLRSHRIPTELAITNHSNSVTGLHAVEIAVRDLLGTRERYAKLLGLSPQSLDASAPSTGGIILREIANVDALHALHLGCEGNEPRVFSLKHTHGVRFEFVSPSG